MSQLPHEGLTSTQTILRLMSAERICRQLEATALVDIEKLNPFARLPKLGTMWIETT